MPTEAAKEFRPGTYEVTNATRRTVVRDEVAFPARDNEGKPSKTTVEVGTIAQYLRLKASRALKVKRVRTKGGDGSSSSSRDLSKDQLVKQAEKLGVSSYGTKAEIEERIQEAEAASSDDPSKAELQERAKELDLPISGSKAEIAERIREAEAGGSNGGGGDDEDEGGE